MSSNTYPTNIDVSAAQRNALIKAGVLPAGSTATRINPGAPGCAPPATVYAPSGPGGKLGCSYDYMEDTEIYPEASKIGFIGRATLQLDPDNQLFNLGLFLNDQVIQRWRHRISFGWDQGPASLTVSNQFSSGYTDQNTTYDPAADKLLPSRRVKAYSLWDLTGSWSLGKQLKLRAGVLNLADTAPPYSNQAYYFLAGYDPTYTDPRGRSAFASVSYAFR